MSKTIPLPPQQYLLECFDYCKTSSVLTWRQQVTACTSPKCPLFPVRPLAEGVDRGLAAKSILVLENGQFAPVPGRDREEY